MTTKINNTDLYDTYRKSVGRASISLMLLFQYCRQNNVCPRTTLFELLRDLGEPPFVDKWPEIKLTLPYNMNIGARFGLSGHTFHYYENNEILAPEGSLVYIIGECGWLSPDVLALPELIDKLNALIVAIAPRIADPQRDSAVAKSNAYWRTKLDNVLATLEDCNKVDAMNLTATERLKLQQLISELKTK